jgi:hypothetical protein
VVVSCASTKLRTSPALAAVADVRAAVVVAASVVVTAAAAAVADATAGKLLSSIFSDRRPGASRAFFMVGGYLFMAGLGATLCHPPRRAQARASNANDNCLG